MVKIGIIGGSGLDNPDVLQDKTEISISTQFGKPSDVLIQGTISGVPCVLLARHGRKHDIMPSNVNYRANIWALKEIGCTHILVTTACGSLKDDKHPGDLVFIDQFIDRTTKRTSTFYDGSSSAPKGICHLPMHTPFCPHTRKILIDVAEKLGYSHHKSGTMVTIEGPRFSTKAESHMFRAWGGDLINMTTVPEVVLAKEAGICYAAIALTTDYDCWHESAEPVSTLKVLQCMVSNSHKATDVIKAAIPIIAATQWSDIEKNNKEEVEKSIML